MSQRLVVCFNLTRCGSALVRDYVVVLKRKKRIIGLVELYAVVLARKHWKIFFDGGRNIYFIDNMPAMQCLVTGVSSDGDWRSILRKFEQIEMERQSLGWYARVLCESNIGDGPSQNDFGLLDGCERTIPICLFTNSMIQW